MLEHKQVVQLDDLLPIPAMDNGEEFVCLDKNVLKTEHRKKDMLGLSGDNIWVRKSVANKLYSVQKEMDDRYRLLVVYGYRSPEIQKKYHLDRYKIIKGLRPDLDDFDIERLVHLDIADPRVAGHPTGGAIDLTIWDMAENREVNMGSAISQFGDIAYTEYPGISAMQKQNRLWLNRILSAVGFAPFMGEWWHFSYGDKEWAFYYKKESAIYEALPQDKFMSLIGTSR